MREVNFALRYLYRIVSRWKSSVEVQTWSWGKYYLPLLGHELHPLTLQSVGSQNALPLLCVPAAGPYPLHWNTTHKDDLYFVLIKIRATHSPTALALEIGGVQRHTPAYLSTERDVGWASGLVWKGTENFVSTGFRTPDLLAHSDLLNRLRRSE